LILLNIRHIHILDERILDERRTSLTPDMVRTLMTVKDGELAKRRAQHTTCNEELVAAFEHVGIDDEEE
jgi:hypothetical protein